MSIPDRHPCPSTKKTTSICSSKHAEKAASKKEPDCPEEQRGSNALASLTEHSKELQPQSQSLVISAHAKCALSFAANGISGREAKTSIHAAAIAFEFIMRSNAVVRGTVVRQHGGHYQLQAVGVPLTALLGCGPKHYCSFFARPSEKRGRPRKKRSRRYARLMCRGNQVFGVNRLSANLYSAYL